MKADEKMSARLAEMVGSENLLCDEAASSSYGGEDFSPRWAVFPGTSKEVKKVVNYCGKESLSIVPAGNGTKMGMGGILKRGDLLLSTKRVNRMIDQDCENLTLTVEGGALFSETQKRMAAEGIGYFVPLDPPFTEASTLGGILAANSSGPKRLLYGTARDLVLGMKVVLADGKTISCGGKTVKNVSGYDMSKLFIGSLGTLGLIVEATVRLLPLPEAEETVIARFSKGETAFEISKEILKSQLIPSSIEILNPTMLREVDAKPLPGGGDYVLAVGVEGVKEAVARQIKDLGEICDRFHPKERARLTGKEQESFWKAVRDSGLTLRTRFPQSVVLKVNVPISKTGHLFALSEGAAREGGIPSALSTHGGSGILQVALLLDESGSASDGAARIIDQLICHASEAGGNLMVEAAPLSVKRRVSVWGREGSDVPLFRRLKSQFDPLSLFNPGKFVGGI